jgi:Nitrile hydratase beta subunit
MNTVEDFMHRLLNDVGGLPSPEFERVDHELKPWEKRCHALADVLDLHKVINTEQRRRSVEALGAEMSGRLGYYERWLTAFSVILFQKGVLAPTRLAEKMGDIEGRWQRSAMEAQGPAP